MDALGIVLTRLGAMAGWLPIAVAVVVVGSIARVCSKRIQYIGSNEQLLLKKLTEKVVINGPGVHFPSYLTTLSFAKRKALSLTELQYLKIKDTGTGACKIVKGPQSYFLGPYESVELD